MTVKKISEDLERLLGATPDNYAVVDISSEGRHLFMNDTRLNIFVYLHYRPCSTLSSIMDFVGRSRTDTEWHLKTMTGAGYVIARKLMKWNIYMPATFSQADEYNIFAFLNMPLYRKVFKEIIHNPGVTITELSEMFDRKPPSMLRIVNTLCDFELVEKVREGRNARLYASGRYKKMSIDFEKKKKSLIKASLIHILDADGLKPELVSQSEDHMELSVIGRDGKRKMVKIPLNPFRTVLED